MSDLIERQAAIDAIDSAFDRETVLNRFVRKIAIMAVKNLPSAQPERCQLSDDDKETIRIHLSAFKEELCNQRRWNEANDYEELIDRFMKAQPARKKGKWFHYEGMYSCSECHSQFYNMSAFCPNCGADMRGDSDGSD